MAHSRKPSRDPDFYTKLTKEVIGSPGLGSSNASAVFSGLNALNYSSSSQPSQQLAEMPESSKASELSKRAITDLDEAISKNPFDFINLLPSISAMVEQHVLAHPEQCANVWELLKESLVEIINNKQPNRQSKNREVVVGNKPTAPLAPKKPDSWINCHGERQTDDYSWLKDKDNEQVIEYINAENKYAESELKPTKPLQRLVFKEFVARNKENDEGAHISMPDGFDYFFRTVSGQEHKQHVRKNRASGVEDIYLDENELYKLPQFAEEASGGQMRLGFMRYSPDCSILAFGVDATGSERYVCLFLDILSGTFLTDELKGIYECLEWSADGKAVFYLNLDSSDRAYQLMRHDLGTDSAADTLIYEESDESFFLSLEKSANGRWLLLNSAAQVTSETRYLSAATAGGEIALVKEKQERVNYCVKAHDSYFYILTNEGDSSSKGKAFASSTNWIYRIPVGVDSSDEEPEPKMVVEPRDFVLVEDFVLHQSHMAVFERSNCHQNVRIIELQTGKYHYISFSEVVYSLWPGAIEESAADLERRASWSSKKLRFTFSTLTTPKQVVDYDMVERTWTVVQQEAVGASPQNEPYNPSHYTQKRLYVTGIDGTTIPLSIVYRTDLLAMSLRPRVDASPANPCLLHSYGAYGSCMNAIFSPTRLALLDRGFVFAIAHVRGGSDMGQAWYEDGKLEKKINSFLDFISCAEFLCNEGYTTREQLAAYGHSAGGLLVAASVMMRPDLFSAVLLEVPFVDVINSMFNTSLPWTAFEYEEWGDPVDPLIYQVMKSYCPYTQLDHVSFAKFPDMLVIGGMNDPRVSFYEPLKFVAKLRNRYHDLLLKRIRDSGSSSLTSEKPPLAPLAKSGQMPKKLDSFEMTMKKRELHLLNVENFEMQIPSEVSKKPNPIPYSRVDVLSDKTLPLKEFTVVLRIEDTGHGGAVGYYAQLKDLAREYAFLITRLRAPIKPVPLGLLLQTGSEILSQGSLILTMHRGSNIIYSGVKLEAAVKEQPSKNADILETEQGSSDDDDDDDFEEEDSSNATEQSPTATTIDTLPKSVQGFKSKFKGLKRMLSLSRSPRTVVGKEKSRNFRRNRKPEGVQDWTRNVF